MNYEENLTYEWLRNLRKKLLKENKVRDYVEPRYAAMASSLGALDIDFTSDPPTPNHEDFVTLDPKWVNSNIVSVKLINGGSVQFHKNYAGRLEQAFESACRATGWTPEDKSKGYCPKPNGGYVPRRDRSPQASAKPVEQRLLGGHTFGTSIDLGTAQENPMYGGGKIRNHPEFINAMKKGGFIWGGDFSNKDDMHFEVNATGEIPPLTPGGEGASGTSSNNVPDYVTQNLSTFYSNLNNPEELVKLSKLSEVKITEAIINNLSDDQIAKLCYDVGFRDEDLVTAVRIVIGESGGNPSATNINRGAKGKYKDSVDRGLFQFNNVAFPNFSDSDAYDPIKSAKFAYETFRKYGFKPWSAGPTKTHTYKSDGVTLDTNKIERAKNAVAKLTGYVSTGNFEYLSNASQGTTSGVQQSDYITQNLSNFYSQLKETKVLTKPLKNNKIFIVKNKSSHEDLKKYFYLLGSMLPYYNKHLQLDQPVKITFVDDDDNAANPLGRTAFYTPEKTSITVFTTGRFIKDILRSLGHELIHHKQHCLDEFQHMQTPEGYAHKDKKLRKKEEEAYLFGNMLFRDWEDKYKAKHAKFKRGLK